MTNQMTPMTYNEIADGIAFKRWPASTQIKMDIEILRSGRMRITTGERRFCGTLGLSITTYAVFTNSMTALSIGAAFVSLAVFGVLD